VDRVKWFHARAARDHAQEEKDTLEEEFQQSAESFDKMSKVWKELSRRSQDSMGAAAYASKQSAMYSKLAVDCSDAFQAAQLKNMHQDSG
jgi:phage-related minor tail protein